MPDVEHYEIYRQPERFAGWPANYGMWAWGDELVVCFTVGHMLREEGLFHLRDVKRSFETIQARSLDGGVTWQWQTFPGRTPGGRPLSADEHMTRELGLEHAMLKPGCADLPQLSPGGFDFTAADVAIMAARTGIVSDNGVRSFFYTTSDRAKSWDGPFQLPMFDLTGVAARTDYQVLGPHSALFFLTANRDDGSEGRMFCARTDDGGATFRFVSYVGQEAPTQRWAIMPSSVQLKDGSILVARRCGSPASGDEPWRHWIDLYRSEDQGASWQLLAEPAPTVGRNGNPPAMLELPDGRLCIIYGYRDMPYGIRAVVSDDAGRSWSQPIHLRDDGGASDLGYPRAIVKADGTVVTAYYFEDEPDGERYIAATHWRP